MRRELSSLERFPVPWLIILAIWMGGRGSFQGNDALHLHGRPVYAYGPPTCQFLTELKPHMTDNVAMLGAIL